jgi:hypothetical protein
MRRSVVVATDAPIERVNILDVSEQEAKKIVLDKIRKVIATRRNDVENALIATGSPQAVRTLNADEFNAAVMNRLSELGARGDAFRNDITKLVVAYYGHELNADGFFVVGAYGRVGQDGEDDENGGSGENVGEILQGSAAVLDSVGGIIGLFAGQNQQNAANNDLSGQAGTQTPPPKKAPWAAIIIGLVVVGAVVGLIIYFNKKKKK